MKYRDMLSAYKSGELAEDLKNKVEYDIERQEAISDYLVDEMEEIQEVRENTENEAEQEKSEREAEKLTKLINKSIRRAFLKMGAAVTALCLAVILFISFGLSPLVSSMYYDPTETVVTDKYGNDINQISMDYRVFSELTMPGRLRNTVSAEDRGFGKYNIEILQNVAISGYPFVNVGGYIDKGELTLYDTNSLKRPSSTMFAGTGLRGEGSISEKAEAAGNDLEKGVPVHWLYSSKEEAHKALEELDGSTFYLGYVSFERDMSFKELQDFLQKLPEDCWEEWYGVRTSDSGWSEHMGYSAYKLASLADWYLEGYPSLNISEGVDSEVHDFDLTEVRLSDEEWCMEHMSSMLKYMIDREEFLELDDNFGVKGSYMEALEYVEQNGLSYYGIVVCGKRADLLEIEGMEEVFGICTETVA